MAKYDRLTEWLKKPKLPLTFSEIETIIGERLPDSAAQHRPWWGK